MELWDAGFDTGALLAKKKRYKRTLREAGGLVPKKVAVLSGATVGATQDMLEVYLLAAGIDPTFHLGGYGLFYENLLFDDGTLAAFAPDVIYIHTCLHNIKRLPAPADTPAEVEALFAAELARFTVAAKAALGFGCPVVLNNFDLPTARVLGNRDGTDPRGKLRFVRRLNEALASLAEATPNLYINDLAYLQAQCGMDAFSDPTAWYAYKYPCAIDKLPLLAKSAAAIIKSLFGRNKKALALDLDNTLWGGVIGDDGPEGIALGNETPTGMAYTAFQQYLKELGQTGVLLNVDSKNELANAEAGFARPDSVLKREDFIAFKANWQPKSENLSAMAKEINLLPDSFVFVDDNPAEREIIRQQLPGVAVPELSAPEEYIRALDRAGWFEVTTLSADDANRTAMYRQNAQRATVEASFAGGSYTDYLKSLAMTGEFGHFDAPHAERITQLINKTNQFNLTTRRYSAAEVEGLIDSPTHLTLYGRLTDRFGDNGIVTALIGSLAGDTLTIDLWVMSCRTFKRELEFALFDQLVADARAAGVKRMVGRYLPTPKNLPVKDFYATLGFALTGETADGAATYTLDNLEGYAPRCTTMEIRRV
ncbi:MAG: HAD-IIIC family phosphatase [Gemmiger sp.]|nr:HAD-IIIC family phosphatase [Gemmiger sp.]